MGIMDLFKRSEKRSQNTARLSDPYLAEFFGLKGGLGSYVDPTRASGLAVAQACINTIAGSLASVPLNLYRRGDAGAREKASEHPLYAVLHDLATPQMTAFEAREMLLVSLLTSGNAFAVLEVNGRGQVTSMRPVNPATVSVEKLPNERLRYKIEGKVYLQEEVLHLRYRLGRDGVMGVSPIQLARDTFGLALTQQEQASKQAQRAFRTEGVLSFPEALSANLKDGTFAALENKFEANSATSGVMVLDGGAEFKATSMTAKDAEFLESRKLTNLDIARIFGLPPTTVGIVDNATYSNVDGESRALVVRCLAPMARRVEQAMNAALLTATSRRSHFIEHDLAGLMRGDMKTRYEGYRIAREWGWMSPNEIRRLENLPAISGGDEYLSPLNMTQLGTREEDDG